MVERGVVELLTLDGRDMSRARDSMKKYKDLPMDLADAALVAVAEREKNQAHLYDRPSGFRKLPSGKTRPVHHTA